MLNAMKETLDKCFTLSKTQRIVRVIELAAKQEMGQILTLSEAMEYAAIQSIRDVKGELEAVKKSFEEDGVWETK